MQGSSADRQKQESPAIAGRAFFASYPSKRSQKGFASIFGDDRSGRGGVELVAESDLDPVLVEVATNNGANARLSDAAEGYAEVRESRGASEIGIAIFGPDRPVVGGGIFEAAADGPADAGRRGVGFAGDVEN